MVSLKDIAHSLTGPFGSLLHESDYVEIGTPMVTVEHLGIESFKLQNLPFVSEKDKVRLSKYILKEGDIVFSRVGSIDRCTYVTQNEDGWMFSGRCLRVRVNEKANARYLSFYFRLRYFKQMMLNISVGATMPSLNTKLLDGIQLYLPTLNKQIQVANLLTILDNKIILNNRINTELESMAKLLYDYWFVQFDFPDENGKPYKSSGGKMVFNQDLKREIPVGWEVGFLGSILKTSLGGTPSTKNKQYWENGEFQWLNSGEIANFPIITSELKITKDAIINSATKLMPKGTVTLSITRHIRPSILAIDACANQSVVGVYETEKIKSSYSYPLICNEVPKYMSLRTGAQQPHINKQTVDKTLMILPSKEILDKYYELANPTYEKININAFQNKELVGLRDWLLPMLMNGQVTVKEAEEKVNNFAMAAEPTAKYKTNQ